MAFPFSVQTAGVLRNQCWAGSHQGLAQVYKSIREDFDNYCVTVCTNVTKSQSPYEENIYTDITVYLVRI